MKYLLDAVSPGHHFAKKLKDTLLNHPNVDILALGIKQNWQNEPLWLL
jgi:hypothetical protein